MLLFIRLVVTSFILFSYLQAFAVKIGVVVPLEHRSMNQIVSGIRESLSDIDDLELIVKNAHGDATIMLSVIKQMKDDPSMSIVMPIGTSTSQMTLANIHDKFIICVAATIDNLSNPLVTGVNDEFPVTETIQKLKSIKKIAIIYSANEKIAPEIKELQAYSLESGISLHLSMIQNLTEMPVAVKSAPDDIESFLILKDHLVVSGVNIIMQEANLRSIPLIASDEGSVISGATVAVGVPEKDVGIESGKMARLIIDGIKPVDIPYKTMDKLVLFLNNESFKKQKILTPEMLKQLELDIKPVGLIK